MWHDGQHDLGAFAFWIHQQDSPEIVEAALREILLNPHGRLAPQETHAYLEQLALNAGAVSATTLEQLLARPQPGWRVLSNPCLSPELTERAWGHILDRLRAVGAELGPTGMEAMEPTGACDVGATHEGLLSEAIAALRLFVERRGEIPRPHLKRLLGLCVDGYRPPAWSGRGEGCQESERGRLSRGTRLWHELVEDLDQLGEEEIEWLFRAAEDVSPGLRARLLEHPASGPGMWAEALGSEMSERVRARAAERLIDLGSDLDEPALVRLALPLATAETLHYHLTMEEEPVAFRRAFRRLVRLDPDAAATVLARRSGRAAIELEPGDVRPLLEDRGSAVRQHAVSAIERLEAPSP